MIAQLKSGGWTTTNLGMSGDVLTKFDKLVQQPHGIVLVTGPTGSGKSTSLYGALNQLNTIEKNIITIEDPVEYQLPGITQIPVNEKKGLTFARGLRSFLRLDFLYSQALYHNEMQSQWGSRAAMGSLLDILAIAARGDVRADVQKELGMTEDELASVLGQIASSLIYPILTGGVLLAGSAFASEQHPTQGELGTLVGPLIDADAVAAMQAALAEARGQG